MAAGLKGTTDFVGYGVGVPSISPVGFVGLLDFTGIPVGRLSGAPPGFVCVRRVYVYSPVHSPVRSMVRCPHS